MTRLWWVRHGPTHAKAFAGWRDIPADLTDAPALARLNAHLPRPAHLISSDLIRASATADCLGDGRSRLPHDPDLREFHFGQWDGMQFAEVSARWPALSRQYWEEPGHIAPPDGESWVQAETRINRAVDRLLDLGGDIVVVAHFGTILTQYARAAGISPYQALAQTVDNLSVTCLAHESGNWQVCQINHRP